MKNKLLTLLLFLIFSFQSLPADFYPIWVEFPVEQLINMPDGYEYHSFGKLYFSPNHMSARFEGLKLDYKNDNGDQILKIFSIPFVLTEITALGNFMYSFHGHTEDQYRDSITGNISVDTIKYEENGAPFSGRVKKFVMQIFSGRSDDVVLQIQNPAWEESDYYFSKYSEFNWGNNFLLLEKK